MVRRRLQQLPQSFSPPMTYIMNLIHNTWIITWSPRGAMFLGDILAHPGVWIKGRGSAHRWGSQAEPLQVPLVP